MIKELYLSFHKNFIFNILLVIFSFFSLLLLFVLFRFSIQTGNHLTEMNREFESVQIFHLAEDSGILEDGVWVESVFQQEEGLERLKSFYYRTLLSDDFSSASVTIHPLEINVDEFRGGEVFQDGYEEGWNLGALPHPNGTNFYVIKAVKLDYFGWNILPMEMLEGREFQADDFALFTGEPVPIILGYKYKDYYDIGDIIPGEFALIEFDLEVIGILESGQVIFHRTPDFFVDYHILIPFLSFGEPQSFEERDLWGFYYTLKALNTHIFVEDTPETVNYMLNAIHTGSDVLNIPYFFSTQDRTFIRHNELNNLIHHHRMIVHILLISVALLVGVITLILERIKYHRRKKVYHIHRLLGISKYKQLLVVLVENFTMYSLMIFAVLYYAVFYSDIIFIEEQRIWLMEEGVSRWPIFWRYITFDMGDFHHVSLQAMAFCGVVLFALSIIYPIVKMNRLYKGGK